MLRIGKRIKGLTSVVVASSIVAGGLSGCFRTALPEFFSELSSDASGALGKSPAAMKELGLRPNLILVSGDEEAPDRTLGHQYVFGFIPLTSLFLPRGPERAAVEIAAELFTERGFSVLLAPEDSVAALEASFGFPPVCRVSLSSPRVNAYDLFLFRSLDVSGDLKMLINTRGEPDESFSVNLNETDYRKFAYGPTVGYRFHKTVRAGIENALSQWQTKRSFFGPRRRGFAAARLRAQSAPMILDDATSVVAEIDPQLITELRPKVAGEIPALLGQQLADSYGYPNALPYSIESLERVLQSGFRKGFPEQSRGVEAWTYREHQLLGAIDIPAGSSIWLMKSTVQILGDTNEDLRLVIDDLLRLTVTVQVEEVSEHSRAILFSRTCDVEAEVDFSLEGGLIEAFSNAATAVSEAIFRGRTEAAKVVCQ